ncbi:hypothetical protein [Caldimonas tepidiphila]|uniref:hypothetical protein n=1 Tax=Caldimonas tepidiphila TaxID=2315841 RepID=UPI0013009672|nr:hypothetical protein [Caldimonas tepidiphila]
MKSEEKRIENRLKDEKMGRAQAQAKQQVQEQGVKGRPAQDMHKASGEGRQKGGSKR